MLPESQDLRYPVISLVKSYCDAYSARIYNVAMLLQVGSRFAPHSLQQPQVLRVCSDLRAAWESRLFPAAAAGPSQIVAVDMCYPRGVQFVVSRINSQLNESSYCYHRRLPYRSLPRRLFRLNLTQHSRYYVQWQDGIEQQ